MKTKRVLRPWVKVALFIIAMILILIGLNKILANDMEKHIEKVYDLEDYMENFEDTSKTINVDIKIKNNTYS